MGQGRRLREVQAYEKGRERKEGEKVEDGEGEDKREVCLVTIFFHSFLVLKTIFYFLNLKTCLVTEKKKKAVSKSLIINPVYIYIFILCNCRFLFWVFYILIILYWRSFNSSNIFTVNIVSCILYGSSVSGGFFP